MICPLAAVGVPPVNVIVVVTEDSAAEVVPTHSSIRAAQLVGVRVCLGVAWKLIPEAEGGVLVETVIDCGLVTTMRIMTSDVPEVVSPVIVNEDPEDQVPVLSGALPESRAGLEPILTL